MICPNCKYEYLHGITKCPDCGADLVYALPPKSDTFQAIKEAEQSADVIIVFESDIGVDLAIAKEILDEAGIHYIESRKPGKFFSSEHKMILEVTAEDADRARSLLAELAEGGSRLVDNVEMEEGCDDSSASAVTVFEPSDQSELSAARSILNRAGIDYNVIDNRDHGHWGSTPVEIQVVQCQADEARALLAELKNNGLSSEQQEP
jgi:hypothetical protein